MMLLYIIEIQEEKIFVWKLTVSFIHGILANILRIKPDKVTIEDIPFFLM